MNQYNRKPSGKLEVCPRCGMDSGERKVSLSLCVADKCYVRCASCGFIVSGHGQSAATTKWNRLSRERP